MTTADFLDGVTRMLALYAPQVTAVTHNLFCSHDTARFRTEANGEAGRLRLATLFQLTMPGAPGIYYGDEIGKSGGDDPDCRRAFPWHRPERWDRPTLEMVRTLTRLRREHPALRVGTWKLAWRGAEAFAYERQTAGERVWVLINRGEALGRHVPLPERTRTPKLLWGRGRLAQVDGRWRLTGVPAGAGAVVLL